MRDHLVPQEALLSEQEVGNSATESFISLRNFLSCYPVPFRE